MWCSFGAEYRYAIELRPLPTEHEDRCESIGTRDSCHSWKERPDPPVLQQGTLKHVSKYQNTKTLSRSINLLKHKDLL